MRKMKHLIAGLMTALLAFQSVPVTSLAAPASAALNPTGVNFAISWKGEESPTYQWEETKDTGRAVTLQVSYSSKQVRAEGYAPGDLVITLNGIGGANRSGNMEAQVGADKAGTTTKTRDWTYTYDRVKDTYTFVNNNAIEGGSVFSGYFELVWPFESRQTRHGYSQDVNAVMYLPYGSGTATINANTIHYADTMAKDTYTVDVRAQKVDQLEVPALPDGLSYQDYYIVKYVITGQRQENARGLSAGEYLDVQLASDAVLVSSNRSYTDKGGGVNRFYVPYTTYGINTSTNEFYLFAAYPKKKYEVSTTDVTVKVYGTYYEESAESLLAQDTAKVAVSDFDFFDEPGPIYDIVKEGAGHYFGTMNDGCYYDGYLNGSIMDAGETATFTILTDITSPKLYFTEANRQKWEMEYVDDWLYIDRNDGTRRKLENDEYEFVSVVIPGAYEMHDQGGNALKPDTYDYVLYASSNGYNDRKEVSRGKIGSASKTVALPAGTTLYSVVITNFDTGVVDLPVKCTVKFHLTKEEKDVDRQDNLTDGQVHNTCFIRLYDGIHTFINEFHKEDYTDPDMAAEDVRTYGTYLDREKATLHIHERFSDFNNSVSLNEFEAVKNGFDSTATNTTTFEILDGETVTSLDSTLLLPQGLTLMPDVTFEEAIWDYVDISGMGLDAEYLAQHCTITFDKDYKGSGDTWVKFHFDFSDSPVHPESSLTTSVKCHLSSDDFKQYGSTYNIYGVSSLEGTAINPALHKTDNGSWITPDSLGSDINQNGSVSELISVRNAHRTIVYPASSHLALNKWVQTTYSNEYVQDVEAADGSTHAPYERLGGTYQYKLKLSNGNNITTDIVITDILETGPNMQWQGTLKSVDTSYAKSLGLTPTVTYARTATPGAGDWTSNIEGAKAVKIDFGKGQLKEGQELWVILNMTAPTKTDLKNKLTENGFKASFTMTDSSSGETTKQDDLTSNLVQVKLSDARYNLILDKKDATDKSVLSGAVFELQKNGKAAATATTNESGRAIFRDVEAGTYTLHEVTPPQGYEAVADRQVVVAGEGSTTVMHMSLEDPRKKGSVVLEKHSDLDYEAVLAGAVYTLYNAADGSVVQDDLKTGADGRLTVSGLEWGSYYFKEKTAPEGYDVSDAKVSFTVSRSNVSETLHVTAFDPQKPATIKLLKYEMLENGTKTTTPLAGAFFTLYKKNGAALSEVGTYGTDRDGEFNITDLPYGSYVLKELKSPNGYEYAADINVELNAKTREVTVTAYDKRMPGTLQVIKEDPEGHIMQGVTFALYKASDVSGSDIKKDAVPAAQGKTDANGVWEATNVAWGSYVLKEMETLQGYLLDNTLRPVTIGPDSLTVRVNVTNERIKGSVTLTKTDESGRTVLSGAVYSLFKDDGTLVQSGLTTDTKGQIVVKDLDWGTYYFKETKAPSGYGLSDELIRFSVNAMTTGMMLEVDATDPVETKQVTLVKKIKKDDIWYPHGTPSFILTLTGQDITGQMHTWNRIVTFSEGALGAPDAQGYVSQSVTIAGIPAGTYTAFEKAVGRYEFARITDVSANGTIKGHTVEFNLVSYNDGSAAFVNDKAEWQFLSDSGSITNLVKASRKLAGLKVVYDGPATLDAGTGLEQYLTVYAVYDDGTTEQVPAGRYELSIPVAPYQSGSYTVTVTYTEGGTTKRGTFTFNINYNTGMHPEVTALTLSVKDGGALEFAPGQAIDRDKLTVVVKYNTNETKTLKNNEYNLGYTPN